MRLFPLIAFLTIFVPVALLAQTQPPFPADLSQFSAQDAAKLNALVAAATGEEKRKLQDLEKHIRNESPQAARLLDAAR